MSKWVVGGNNKTSEEEKQEEWIEYVPVSKSFFHIKCDFFSTLQNHPRKWKLWIFREHADKVLNWPITKFNYFWKWITRLWHEGSRIGSLLSFNWCWRSSDWRFKVDLKGGPIENLWINLKWHRPEAKSYPLLTLVWLHDKNWYLNKLFVSSAVFFLYVERQVLLGGG